jgi:hypothetical protein
MGESTKYMGESTKYRAKKKENGYVYDIRIAADPKEKVFS